MMPKQEKSGKKEIVQAAALQYDASQDRAPYIVGIGRGLVAENMVKKAQEKDIPVVEDANIAKALQHLSAGDEIPEELYQVIAEVLVFITRLDGDLSSRWGLSGALHSGGSNAPQQSDKTRGIS